VFAGTVEDVDVRSDLATIRYQPTWRYSKVYGFTRVSNPASMSCESGSDPGFQIFADLDPDPGFEKYMDSDLGPGLDFFQKSWFLREKSKIRTVDLDHNADLVPDRDTNPGT